MSKWISEQTAGLLNPTFTPDPMQVLSLINTLYFEGAWSDSFQAANNTTEKFTLADGSQVDATYMNQTFDHHSYYETEDYILFELGFVGGQSMRLVLPKEGKELNSLLTEQSLKAILSSPEDPHRNRQKSTSSCQNSVLTATSISTSSVSRSVWKSCSVNPPI